MARFEKLWLGREESRVALVNRQGRIKHGDSLFKQGQTLLPVRNETFVAVTS